MIHIEEDFATGGVDGFADLESLRNFAEEHSGVIAVGVKGFEHHNEIVFFQNFGHGFEAVNDVGRLVIPGEAEVVGAGDDGHPFGADAFGAFCGGFGFLFEVGTGFFASESVDGFAPFGIGDEDSEGHSEVAHFLAELFLHFGGLAHHAVIFPGVESLIGGKLELVEEIFAGVIFEHAEVGGVFELKLGGLGHGRVCEPGSGDEAGGHGGRCFEYVTSGGLHWRA